jgi:ligand-binding sensor domain-containing protein
MTPSARALLCAAVAAVVCAGGAAALAPDRTIAQYIHRTWTDLDGLPSSLARGLAQTPDGYLWVGTTEGLARFDGFRFVVYNRANTPEFRENEIRGVFVDSRGCLWVGFPATGVVRRCGGPWERLGPPDAFAGNDFAEDVRANVHVSTDRGVLRFEDGGFRSVDPSVESSPTTGLAADQAGRIWYASHRGALSYLDDGGAPHAVPLPGPLDTPITLAFPAPGELLLGTFDGLYRWRGGRLDRIDRFLGLTDSGGGLLVDRDGNLWSGGWHGGGLARIRGNDVSHADKRHGLTGDRVLRLLEDREGNLWASTWDGGLNRFTAGAFITYSVQDGLAGDAVRSISEDRAGHLWIGTGSGLSRFDGRSWRSWARADGLPHDTAYVAAELPGGDILVGTLGGLAVVRDDRVLPVAAAGPPISSAFSLLVDRLGRVWIGTGTQGLARLNEGRIELLPGTGATVVYTLFLDRAGTLWAGTLDGLYRLAPGAAALERVEVPHDRARLVVVASLEDSRGDLWFGTIEGGVIHVRDGVVRWLTTRDGLFDDTAFGILEDASGDLWLSTARGIYTMARRDVDAFLAGSAPRLRYRLFDEDDGLATRSADGGNGNAAYRTRDGRLWFATIRGLSVVDPATLPPPPPPPPVLLESVAVAGQPQPLAAGLDVGPGRTRLDVEYTAIHLRAPSRLRFRHRLAGLEPGWIEAGARRQASYPAVPPGDYAFEVQASLDGERWGPATTLTLAVAPHFWQTGWFAALFAGVLAAAVAGGVRLRLAALRRRSVELEAIVAARTGELVEEQRRAADAEQARERAQRELEATRELEGLVDFGRAVAGILDPDEIVARLDHAVSVRWGGAWRALVAWREGREVLLHEAGDGATARLDAKAVAAVAAGIPGWRRARLLVGAGGDASASSGLIGVLADAGAVAAAPLVSGATMVGVVAIGPRRDGRAYDERDLAHLLGLATQAALALEGAWQAQEALRWQYLSEARREWLQLDVAGRVAFAAVARLGAQAPLDRDTAAAATAQALGGGAAKERAHAAIARLVEHGVLLGAADGSLRIGRPRWLALPEIRLPLAEIARQAAARVGAYRLAERIGSGGMAEVYHAVNVHDGSPAAVKLLHPHLTADRDARDRLEREGELAAAIDHPNVVRLLERGEHEGRLYLAMELLAGETLAARLRRGPLPLAEAVRAGRQLASGLAALHAAGVVHRDVNSANVMIADDGRYVLLDLGLARGLASTTLTQAQTVLGTLPYMSPEQLRGEPLDPRTDLWSLGVVLHEMLTGELPWDGDTSVRMALEILGAREVPARRLAPDLPAPLRDLLARLLDPDRDRRLASASAVAQALVSYPV